MDELVYFWPNGEFCYRYQLTTFTECYGDGYDTMYAEQFFAMQEDAK